MLAGTAFADPPPEPSDDGGPRDTVFDLTFVEFICFATHLGEEPDFVDRVCGTNLTGDYPDNSNPQSEE